MQHHTIRFESGGREFVIGVEGSRQSIAQERLSVFQLCDKVKFILREKTFEEAFRITNQDVAGRSYYAK